MGVKLLIAEQAVERSQRRWGEAGTSWAGV